MIFRSFSLFPIFIWIFNWIFYLKIAKKRGFIPTGADVASGGWCGTRDRLEVRRGTEATWQSPSGPRRRRKGHDHVAGRPHDHVGSCVGRHVGGWYKRGHNEINRGIHSPIYTRLVPLFLPCGTMFPHDFVYCRWRGDTTSIGSRRKPSIAWTGVHAIIHQSTRWKNRLSGLYGQLTCCHVELSGVLDPHRTDGVAIAIIIAIFFHRTADVPRNLSPRDRAILTIHSPEVQSDDGDKSWKNPTIAVRSSRDRAAITTRPSRDRTAFVAESIPQDQTAADRAPGSRSRRDCGLI